MRLNINAAAWKLRRAGRKIALTQSARAVGFHTLLTDLDRVKTNAAAWKQRPGQAKDPRAARKIELIRPVRAMSFRTLLTNLASPQGFIYRVNVNYAPQH